MIHTNRTITIISNHISLSPPLTKTTYYDDMGKSRVPIAAGEPMNIEELWEQQRRVLLAMAYIKLILMPGSTAKSVWVSMLDFMLSRAERES